MVLRKKATETTGKSAKCDKDDFHSKLPWKSFCPYSILQIFMKELFEFVERNDIGTVVQVRMVCSGNDHQFLVITFQLLERILAEIT